MPMMLRRNRSFFELKDARLLCSILNEVLNGFVVDDFEAAIGIKRAELQDLLTQLNRLQDDVPIELDLNRTTAFRNALRITLRELGVEEFHTRTGYDLQEGMRVLQELDDAIDLSLT